MLVNPAGLFGGGAVKLDTTSATNYYLSQKAKEDAKAESLDKYFSTLTSKANEAGMRDQEKPAFRQAVQNYENFFNQNKAELTRGRNYKLQAKAQQLGRLPFQIAEDSKSALRSANQFWQTVKSNPDNMSRISNETMGLDEDGNPLVDPVTKGPTGIMANDESVWVQDASGNLINNPRYKAMKFQDMVFNPKLLDGKAMEDRQTEAASGFKPELIKEETVSAKTTFNPFGISTTKIYGFSDDKRKAIGDNAFLQIEDPQLAFSWKKAHPFSKWKDPANKAEFDKYNEVFQKLYQRPMANDKDLYVASTIIKNDIPRTDVIPGKDEMAEFKSKEAIKLANEFNLARKKAALSGASASASTNEGNAFDTLPDGKLPNGLNVVNGVILGADGKPYNSAAGKKDIHLDQNNIPATVVAVVKNSGLDPKNFAFYPGVDIEVKNGKIINMANDFIGNVDRNAIQVFQGNYKKKTNKAPFDPQ